MRDRILDLADAAASAIERLAREVLARKPGGHIVEAAARSLELRVPLWLDGDRCRPSRLAAEIAGRLDRLVENALEQAAVFRPGHAFCHKCRGAGCIHSEPPSCRHVFTGYGPTGVPQWEDLAQVCLERRHPDVDRLYEEPPAFVVLPEEASQLRRRLLRPFDDRRRCELLGQVAAGFYRPAGLARAGRGVLALTFQILASRNRDGAPRLGLNVIGRPPEGQVSVERLWERASDVPWRMPVRWAQRELDRVARLAGRLDAGGLARRVERIVQELARRLEREQRARARRTHHAEQRHLAGDRPTRKAFEDARRARAAEILFDERNRTFVVPGDRGRTHFFTSDGRLVTSVRYSRDAIERKRKLGVWREADVTEADRLLRALAEAGPPGGGLRPGDRL